MCRPGDPNNHSVKDARSALNHVDVPVGDWIKCSWIDGNSHDVRLNKRSQSMPAFSSLMTSNPCRSRSLISLVLNDETRVWLNFIANPSQKELTHPWWNGGSAKIISAPWSISSAI